MIYKIYFYHKGKIKTHKQRTAKTHLAALKHAAPSFVSWSHAVVVSQNSVRRYNSHFKPVKGEWRLFRTFLNEKPTLLLMTDKYGEMYPYGDETARQNVIGELCIHSKSAASAKASPEPTDTTASTEETSVSKNFSTFLKISNGFVTSVTCWDLLTRTSIDKNFGQDSVRDLESNIWQTGSTAYRSKRQQSFLATVKDMRAIPHPIYVAQDMQDMVGQTILVEKSKTTADVYIGEGWAWHKSYLDFRNVLATVKIGSRVSGWYLGPEIEALEGDTLKMKKCDDHYTYRGTCIPLAWLVPGKFHTGTVCVATVKDIKPGTVAKSSKGNIIFTQEMEQYCGKTLEFKKIPGGFSYDGYKFHKSWIELEDKCRKSGKKQKEESRDSWVVSASPSQGEQEVVHPTSTTINIPSKSSTGRAIPTGLWMLLNKPIWRVKYQGITKKSAS